MLAWCVSGSVTATRIRNFTNQVRNRISTITGSNSTHVNDCNVTVTFGMRLQTRESSVKISDSRTTLRMLTHYHMTVATTVNDHVDHNFRSGAALVTFYQEQFFEGQATTNFQRDFRNLKTSSAIYHGTIIDLRLFSDDFYQEAGVTVDATKRVTHILGRVLGTLCSETARARLGTNANRKYGHGCTSYYRWCRCAVSRGAASLGRRGVGCILGCDGLPAVDRGG